MFPSTTNRAGALVMAFVVLTGAGMLPAAAADPNPDDQFVALLDRKGIPALENVPSLIATAHRICRQLDGGMPADGVVDDMKRRAFNANAAGGPYPPDRVMRTVARFISASVEAYCPNNQPKIAALQSMANPVPGSSAPSQRSTVDTHTAAFRAISLVRGPFPSGETGEPDPPQLPPPPPPTAQIMTPPRPVTTPSPPQRPLPAQQSPSGPPQEPGGPQPSGPAGGGGAGPEPPPMPPGRVRLAP